MKKRAVILSMLVILLVFQIFSDIKSEINLINGNIAYTAFPTLDAPVSMDKETITIDNTSENSSYVNDKYVMTNTSSEKVSLPIIFPVLKNINEHEDIELLINGEKKVYSIKWLLDSEKYAHNNVINIDELLVDFNYKQNYKYKNINPNEMVWIYEVLLEDENNEIKIENSEETLEVLYEPLNTDKYKVSKKSNSAEFSIDNSIQDKFRIVIFDKQLNNINFESNLVYTKKKMKLSQYIRQVINREYNHFELEKIDINSELLPHILYYIDKNMDGEEKILPLDNILNNHLDLIRYTVEFEPNEIKIMELNYKIQSTYDIRKTTRPIHTYKYDLYTSKYWNTFNDFVIEFEVGEEYKYLIESSIPFVQVENKFIASLYNAPENIISYSIYSEDIDLDELLELKVKKKIKVISGAILMILLIFTVYKIAIRKNKEITFYEESKND